METKRPYTLSYGEIIELPVVFTPINLFLSNSVTHDIFLYDVTFARGRRGDYLEIDYHPFQVK